MGIYGKGGALMQSPVLSGWDDIAKYLQVNDRTAMEWERSAGLPVARVNGYVLTTTGLVERWIIKNLRNPKIRGLNTRKNLPTKQTTDR